MPEDIYDRLDVPHVVNGVGFATRVGGSCPAEGVLEAMRQAQQAYVEIDDLQAAASRLIAQCTGAEAGIVTCGASAGLTLAAAACLAGNDPGRMDRLPDVRGLERFEIIYPKAGPYDYEHPLRLAGARLVELDYASDDGLQKIEAAIGPHTAALGYAWYNAIERPAVEALALLAHRHGLPLIVDAAMSLPPVENLRRFTECGADLTVFSGGKHLGGPQASGILCGRRDLVRSAWVQMVDMDVRVGTWSLNAWVEEGWIARPPRHGVGRTMKVGKESIAGLLAALEAYGRRDHASELEGWKRAAEEIVRGLGGLRGLQAKVLFPAPSGQPFPAVRLEVQPAEAGFRLRSLIAGLRVLRPKVVFAEDEHSEDRAYIYTMCLRPGEPGYVAESVRKVAGALSPVERSNPCPTAT